MQKDFYTRENSDIDDNAISMPFLKSRLEELLKSNELLREQISGVLDNKGNMRQQDLVAAIWNIIFGPWMVPLSATTETITTTTTSSESDNSSNLVTTPTPIKINRTRRPTKYKIRGFCKNPPKKHLPENELQFDLIQK